MSNPIESMVCRIRVLLGLEHVDARRPGASHVVVTSRGTLDFFWIGAVLVLGVLATQALLVAPRVEIRIGQAQRELQQQLGQRETLDDDRRVLEHRRSQLGAGQLSDDAARALGMQPPTRGQTQRVQHD